MIVLFLWWTEQEVERAFSEFHRMYERNRAAAESLHKNEEALKKALAAYQERLQQEQHKYETLKLHAAQKLEAAQQETENMRRNLEAESSRIKAVLKKTEMRLSSVETSLEQKTKENEELTTLCDELINKLGSSANRWWISRRHRRGDETQCEREKTPKTSTIEPANQQQHQQNNNSNNQ